MLKVAVIIERADIGLGGAERSVSELADELRRQGVDACILAAKGTPSENTKILCADVPGKRISLNVFENALLEHLKVNAYDLVHSTLPLLCADIYQPRGGSYREAMLQNIASYPSALYRTIKRRTHFLNLKRTQYLNAEARVCQDGKATVAALSDYVRRQFQKHYNLPENRIAVIPNGVNPAIKVNGAIAASIKQKILQSADPEAHQRPVLFLMAANNPRLKGLAPLLAAMKKLSRDIRGDICPILVTVGAQPVNARFKHIVSLGQVDGIANVLSACDVAVLPTWYDPCSRFILEALALGKPVITTRFNGAAERFDPHRHGRVLDRPDDIDALMAAMAAFCDREKIELAQKAIVEDNLKEDVSIARHVALLIGLYHRIMNEKEP